MYDIQDREASVWGTQKAKGLDFTSTRNTQAWEEQ